MGSSKSSSDRRGRFIRHRLSYANVMATMAFFLAVAGGSAYAVSQIDGSQIRNHSISANKLARGLVVPNAKHAITATNVSHLLVSSSKLSRRHGAHVAATSGGSLVTLSVGQSAAIFQNTPFTITATCTDQGNGVFRAAIEASASVDGWYAGGPAQPAGATVTMVQMTSSSGQSGLAPGEWFLAPGGASLTLQVALSVHEIGDCSFELYAIG